MDIAHLKYVVEVARTGSITQAASNLGMNQPNLSKTIKALEREMGIIIFRRTSKGVFQTTEGEAFVTAAQEILNRVEALEDRYKAPEEARRTFGISVPRASYISYAFAQFVAEVAHTPSLRFDFCETSSIQAIQNVSSQRHRLGIIRFSLEHKRYYDKLLRDSDICGESLLEFKYRVVLSENNPIADKPLLIPEDLTGMIEVIQGDLEAPVSMAEALSKQVAAGRNTKTIGIYERGSQLELLSLVPGTYMWAWAIPEKIRKRYQLVEKEIDMPLPTYCDLLIQPERHSMSDTECRFLKHLYLNRDISQR